MARQKKSAPKRKTRPTTYRPEREPVVPHFIRTQIKELLSGYPSGLLGSMFALAFHRRFGQELSYEKLRFKSLGHLLESMSDVVRIEDMRGGGYRVYGKTNDKVNLGMLNSVDFFWPWINAKAIFTTDQHLIEVNLKPGCNKNQGFIQSLKFLKKF